MAKRRNQLTAFEEEVVNYYADDYLEAVRLSEDHSIDELEKLVIKSRYGEDYRAPMLVIDWGDVFNKHVCPVCGDLISMHEKQYVCGKCGLTVPLELYDKALASYEKEVGRVKRGGEFSRRISEKGLKSERVRELYDMGVDRAQQKLSEDKKPR